MKKVFIYFLYFLMLIGMIFLLSLATSIYLFGKSPNCPMDEYVIVIRNMSGADIDNLQIEVGRTRSVCEIVPVIQKNTCYKIRFKTAEVDSEPPNNVYVVITNNDGSTLECGTGYFEVGLGNFALVDITNDNGVYTLNSMNYGTDYDKYHRRHRWKPFEKEWDM